MTAPGSEASVPLENAAETEPSTGPVVRVTYFTDNIKCENCRLMEALTRQTVSERYPAELASGRVFYEKRNMDDPANAGLVKDYGLSFKTVVIADVQDGRVQDWERMDDVWNLLHREPEFLNYVSDQIDATLQAQEPPPQQAGGPATLTPPAGEAGS